MRERSVFLRSIIIITLVAVPFLAVSLEYLAVREQVIANRQKVELLKDPKDIQPKPEPAEFRYTPPAEIRYPLY